MSAGRAQKGFTYVGFLLAVAIMGAGLVTYSELASHAAQREKEAELLFRGNQYRAAIASYYKKEQRFPKSLADLLEDKRYPMPVRHLRKLYPDPMAGTPAWGLIEAPEGGIMGVYSLSEEAVLQENLAVMRDALDKHYADAGKYPTQLEELVAKRYLRTIPRDPFTQSAGTWIAVPPADPKSGGVFDIHSAAKGYERW